jgi:hypothetical protein
LHRGSGAIVKTSRKVMLHFLIARLPLVYLAQNTYYYRYGDNAASHVPFTQKSLNEKEQYYVCFKFQLPYFVSTGDCDLLGPDSNRHKVGPGTNNLPD